MYTLFYSPGSASLLVHWLLIETDAPHTLVKVDTASGEHKRPEYLAMNPNGVVPTLSIDGHPHYEAAAMAMHLAEAFPQAGLAPAAGDPSRAAYLQWMFNLANMVQPLLRHWWYPHEPAGDAQADAVRERLDERLGAHWARIDAHLAAHGPYVLGAAPSAADFYLTMLMRWSRNTPRPATTWPHLAALASAMAARPSFATLYAREGLSEWP
ncbi:MAG: glutathione S-transferase family protein [Xanthomonadaceae bacterium]|nr:glutathione S-transferase family protein [Xanthomonadaceae bacterium]